MAMAQGLRQATRSTRSRDPQRREDRFRQLLPHAADHRDELTAQFEHEQDDHGPRCWLLELAGAARSPAALPLLRTQPDSDDDALRSRAAAGLTKPNTPEARTLPWHARANGTIS